MAKASEYRRCSVGNGLLKIDMPVHKNVLERALNGDVTAQNAIVKKFSQHLRNLGIFSLDTSKGAVITYEMLHIDT